MSEQQWTVDSLKEFLVRVIDANDKRYEQRFEDAKASVNTALISAERAVLKAESASEKRFDAVNEFRSTLADQQRTLMPRAEAEIINKSLSDRITAISDGSKLKEGEKKGSSESIAWVVTGISVAITIVSLVIKFKP